MYADIIQVIGIYGNFLDNYGSDQMLSHLLAAWGSFANGPVWIVQFGSELMNNDP